MIAFVYILFFTVLLVVFYRGWWIHLKKQVAASKTYELTSISVVIPFRNEVANLPKLVESISKLTKLPLEFIWVNDHSEDDSLVVLQNLPENHRLISLSENEFGKKSAIRQGIQYAKGEFILTWDADITVPTSYFEKLQTTPIADLHILPVRMVSNTLIESFYELDYYFLSSINIAVSAFAQPIVASGANLLFKKAAFQSLDSYPKHKNIASGDDLFLLTDFKRAKKDIQTNTCSYLTVETETPNSLNTFFQQRLRWIGKTSHINDQTTNAIGLLGFLYLTTFIYLLFTPHWFVVLVLKIVFDMLILLPYLHCLRRKKITWSTPFFTLIYPVYFILIIGLNLIMNPQWKGRKKSMGMEY